MSTTQLVKSDAPNPFAVVEAGRGGGLAVETQRAVQEVQAALVIAKKFPRDENAAIERIRTACQRQGLAEIAEYEYSRGGTRITGPTVDLLKAIASRWGNIEFGWKELERRDGGSQVLAFAWDMQTNARQAMTFFVKHWRDTQSGGYALTDERDIYEAVANVAARRMRACMESVIDSDVIDLATDECHKTLRNQKVPLEDRVRAMTAAFKDDFQVTVEMLEARLGNKLSAISENQLASLRRVYKSLKDGVGKREEFFKAAPPADNATSPDLGKKSDDDDGDLGPQMRKATSSDGKAPEQHEARSREMASAQGGAVASAPSEAPNKETPPTVSLTVDEIEKPYEAIMERLKRDNVTEDEVMAFLRSKKVAKDTQQEIQELATGKLLNLLKQWPQALAAIRKGRTDVSQ